MTDPIRAALAAPPAPAPEPATLTFTLREARELVETFGGDEACEMSVRCYEHGAIKQEDPQDGPSPAGLWSYATDYPEEGAIYLGPVDADAPEPTAAPVDDLGDDAAMIAFRAQYPSASRAKHIYLWTPFLVGWQECAAKARRDLAVPPSEVEKLRTILRAHDAGDSPDEVFTTQLEVWARAVCAHPPSKPTAAPVDKMANPQGSSVDKTQDSQGRDEPTAAPATLHPEHRDYGIMQAMVRALAAIDDALGIEQDGCNSTALTLLTIDELKEQAARGEALARAVMSDQTGHDAAPAPPALIARIREQDKVIAAADAMRTAIGLPEDMDSWHAVRDYDRLRGIGK